MFFVEGFLCITGQKPVEGETSYRKSYTSGISQYIEA
jgi:hypothetical protein